MLKWRKIWGLVFRYDWDNACWSCYLVQPTLMDWWWFWFEGLQSTNAKTERQIRIPLCSSQSWKWPISGWESASMFSQSYQTIFPAHIHIHTMRFCLVDDIRQLSMSYNYTVKVRGLLEYSRWTIKKNMNYVICFAVKLRSISIARLLLLLPLLPS